MGVGGFSVNELAARMRRSASFRLLCATLLGQAIAALLTPVLTRLVTPADLGAFSPFLSAAGILLPVMSLRYEWAIPIARTDSDAARLVQISVGLLVGFSLVLLVLAGITAFPTERAPANVSLILLFAPMAFVMGAVQVLSGWVLRVSAFDALAKARVSNATLVISGQILLALALPGPLALALGLVLGQALAFLPICLLARRQLRSHLAISAPSVTDVLREHRRFPQFSAPSSLINSIGVETPILLSILLLGPAFTGHLALALRIVAIPGVLAAGSLAQTFYAEAARQVREEPMRLRSFYRRSLLRFVPIGLAVLLIGLLCPWLFPLVFGAEWALAGQIALWLSVAACSSISLGTISCLEYLGRQGLNLFWNTGRLLAVVVSMLVTYQLTNDGVWMVAVLSVTSAAWYPVLYLLNEFALSRANKVETIEG